MKFKYHLLLSVFFSLLLIGCGGGSSSKEVETPAGNKLPEVSVENTTANEKQLISLVANAADSDGNIVSYQWRLTSEHEITEIELDNSTLEFVAPEIYADTQMSFNLMVTDNDGATATTDVTVDLKQLTIELNIEGLATDSPLANANISVMVGTQHNFEFTADQDGFYSAELIIDDSFHAEFVTIIAQGVNDQKMAALASYLGSVDKLSQLAGNDKVLSSDELFAVNISNLTTAQYALLKRANDNIEISSDNQLEQLMLKIDLDNMIEIATAIKVAIDYAYVDEDYLLPQYVDTTLELANNESALNLYFDEVLNSNSYYQAQEEMFANSEVFNNKKLLPNSYYLPSAQKTIISENYSSWGAQSYVFDLNEDGGNVYFDGFNEKFIISETNSYQIIDPTVRIGTERIYSYPDWIKVDKEIRTTEFVINPIFTANDYAIVRVKETIANHIPDGFIRDYSVIGNSYHIAYTNNNTKPITNNFTQAYLALNDAWIDGNTHVYYDKFIFNTNGTGITNITQRPFSWEKADKEVAINFSDTLQSLVINQLPSHQGSNTFVFAEIINEITTKEIAPGLFTEQDTNFTAQSPIGIYVVSSDQYGNSDKGNYFWFEVLADNKFHMIIIDDRNLDGVVDADELYVRDGNWQLNNDGSLTINRYLEKGSLDAYMGCNHLNDNCFAYLTQQWNLAAINDDEISIFRKYENNDYIDYDGSVLSESDYKFWSLSTYQKIIERPISIDQALETQASMRGKSENLSQKANLIEIENQLAGTH